MDQKINWGAGDQPVSGSVNWGSADQIVSSATQKKTQSTEVPSLGEQALSLAKSAFKPIADLPSAYSGMVHEATDRMRRGVSELGQGASELGGGEFREGLGDIAGGAGRAGLGAMDYVSAPVNAPIHTIVGEPVARASGSPLAGDIAETAATFALPIPKELPRLPEGKPLPPPTRILDVTLSQGQAGRDLPAIQREQAALRGQSGPPAQRVAQTFTDQQKAELAAAKNQIARTLGQGKQVAETPQEAGDLVSQAMQLQQRSAKSSVDQAYKQARSYGGEIGAGAFEGMGQKIKGALSLRSEPVIIDSKLTPFASQMIDDVDHRVSQLKIENKASHLGEQPPLEEIAGVNIEGVDQMRKRLSTMRKDAYASGNGADARAAKAVLDSFDDKIDAAINGGHFRGDQRAIKAWNDARAAYADYSRTFTAGKNDPVGRVVEKIIGKGNNPAAIPNDVADYMYGAAGTNPSGLNVGVVNRIKKIVGETSPQWSAAKQGLFRRLVEPTPGMTDYGPGKVAQRLTKFIDGDGKEMANTLFSDSEKGLLRRYADLMRHLEVPQAGAGWSNTATFAGQGYKPSMSARVLNAIGGKVGMVVGAVIGHGMLHTGLPYGGEVAGAVASKIAGMSGQAMEARVIAKQMPIIKSVSKKYYTAATAAEQSPTRQNLAKLVLASRNLANNLKDLGINISPEQLIGGLQNKGQQQKQRNNISPPSVLGIRG